MEQLEPRTLLTIIANTALQLTIDYPTGAASLSNTSGASLLMDLYQIKSTAGNLLPATWYSIADASAANPTAVKAALGNNATTFSELGPSASSLSEGSWTSNAVFPAGAKWNIGLPVAANAATLADLVLQYHTTDETPGDAYQGVVVVLTSAVTVDTLSTWDTTPALSGTVNNPTADIRVTVGGHTYAATNNGDGTWSLPDNAITSPLAYGTLNVSVSALMGTTTVAQDSSAGELTIVNSPVVAITKTKDAAETLPGAAAKNGLFTVTRVGGDLTASLDVHYTLDAASTAASGADFTALSGVVTFAPGQRSATIAVPVLDDLLAEPAETVTVDLTPSLVYHSAAGTDTATVSIADNEPIVSIVKTKVAAETPGPVAKDGVFLVKRVGGDMTALLDLHYSVDVASTANSGVDYVALTGVVTIPAGKPTATITVAVIDDLFAEPAETVIVNLDTPTAYHIAPAKGSATVSIADNEPTVSIYKTKDAAETLPGAPAKNGIFTVKRTGGNMAASLDVYYSIDAASTATSGDDYTALTGMVTIPAGKPSATITVAPKSDSLAEPKETVVVKLDANPTYNLLTGKGSATVSIADNAPFVSIVRTKNGSQINGSTTGKGIFTVTRAGGDLTQDLVVHYSIDPSSQAVSGSDFAALSGTVTILAGQKSATIEVLVASQPFVVPTKTLVLDLSTDSLYHLGTTKTTATLLILGN